MWIFKLVKMFIKKISRIPHKKLSKNDDQIW